MNFHFAGTKYWPILVVLLVVVGIGAYSYGVSGGLASFGSVVPNKLIVTRHEDTNDKLPAFDAVIANEAVVAKLYSDIYSPSSAMPSGTYNCPNQKFVTYNLDFYKDDQLVLHAEYNPTGCRIILLSSGSTRSAEYGNFNDDLKKALGLGVSFYGGD